MSPSCTGRNFPSGATTLVPARATRGRWHAGTVWSHPELGHHTQGYSTGPGRLGSSLSRKHYPWHPRSAAPAARYQNFSGAQQSSRHLNTGLVFPIAQHHALWKTWLTTLQATSAAQTLLFFCRTTMSRGPRRGIAFAPSRNCTILQAVSSSSRRADLALATTISFPRNSWANMASHQP